MFLCQGKNSIAGAMSFSAKSREPSFAARSTGSFLKRQTSSSGLLSSSIAPAPAEHLGHASVLGAAGVLGSSASVLWSAGAL